MNIMSVIINFSDELRAWIIHNFQRGCDTEAMVAAMIDQRFDAKIARSLVESFKFSLSNNQEPARRSIEVCEDNLGHIYESPRIAEGSVIYTSDRNIPVLFRMKEPIIALLGNVLTPQECERLIELAKPRLKPSTIVDYHTGGNLISDRRDSEGTFFAINESPFIATLDQRISEIMRCPIENGEGLQIVRYGTKAKNEPHYDFLIPNHSTNQASIQRSGQRVSTLILYLNDVEEGGETDFPEVGLSILPKKGNALYFEYFNSFKQLDLKSVHAGAPVKAGEKWIATKWMREKRFIVSN